MINKKEKEEENNQTISSKSLVNSTGEIMKLLNELPEEQRILLQGAIESGELDVHTVLSSFEFVC